MEVVRAGEGIKKALSLMMAISKEIKIMEAIHRIDHDQCKGCSRTAEIDKLRDVELLHTRELPGLIGSFQFTSWLVGKGEIKGGRTVAGLEVPKFIGLPEPAVPLFDY